jgi:hypothetical protein
MEISVFIGIGVFRVLPGSVETDRVFPPVSGLVAPGIVFPPASGTVEPGVVFPSVVGADVFDEHPIGIKNRNITSGISNRIRCLGLVIIISWSR